MMSELSSEEQGSFAPRSAGLILSSSSWLCVRLELSEVCRYSVIHCGASVVMWRQCIMTSDRHLSARFVEVGGVTGVRRGLRALRPFECFLRNAACPQSRSADRRTPSMINDKTAADVLACLRKWCCCSSVAEFGFASFFCVSHWRIKADVPPVLFSPCSLIFQRRWDFLKYLVTCFEHA